MNILTKYENNNGSTENCLEQSEEVLEQRTVDHVDIALDQVRSSLASRLTETLASSAPPTTTKRRRTFSSSAVSRPSVVPWLRAGGRTPSPSCAPTSWWT